MKQQHDKQWSNYVTKSIVEIVIASLIILAGVAVSFPLLIRLAQ